MKSNDNDMFVEMVLVIVFVALFAWAVWAWLPVMMARWVRW